MLVIKHNLIVFFLCVISAHSIADITQKNKINILLQNLKKTENVNNAKIIEKKIWSLWHKHPSNPNLTDKLELGMTIMDGGNYEFALKIFDNIIEKDPMWAEAWNKRATLMYLIVKYDQSLKDIDSTLKIEPRHFGALSGKIQILLKQKKYLMVLNNLKKLKMINPTRVNNNLIIELEELVNGLNI